MPDKDTPKHKDPKRGLTRLFNIAPAEVSLVSSGANRRKFLFYKNKEGSGAMGAAAELFSKGGPGSGPRKGGGKGEHQAHPGASASGHQKEHDAKEQAKSEAELKTPKGNADRLARNAERTGGGEKKVIGQTQSGKDIHEEGNKGSKSWSAQDHMDAFHAHTERGMDKSTEMMAHPSFQAAQNHGDYHRDAQSAAAIASDPKVWELQAQSDKHHQIAESHYQAAKKKEGVKKSSDEIRDKIAKASPETMAKAGACLDGYVMKDADGNETPLDDDSRTVARAMVRIMAPFAEKIPADLAHKLLDVSGYVAASENEGVVKASDEVDEDDDESDDEVEGVSKKAMAKAMKAAMTTYQEHLTKSGYGNGPKVRMVMKLGGEPVKKSKGEHVSKSSEAPDLAGLDPKVRERLEGVFKTQAELVAKNTELVAKNADLASRLDVMAADTRKRELVVKAAGYKNLALPQDQIVAQLEMGDKLGKEAFELVCKSFDTLDGQAKQGRLFGEIGSNLSRGGGAGGGDSWSRIEAAAEGWVSKSGKSGLTKEQATAAFLESSEGQRLYAEHQAARPEGI